jgi:hypothetical protein
MRTLPIALVAATLTIPSAGYSQDQGLVGGKVGPGGLESSSPGQPGSSAGDNNPYDAPHRAPQERPGYAGTVSPGQVVNRSTPMTPHMDGMGVAVVNGHRVLVDPNSRRIMRVIN